MKTIKELIQAVEKDVNLTTILEIRTYIPIAEKRAILEAVLDKCFTVKDGVLTCDYVLKKLVFELAMIKYHTDLDINISSEDDYDEIQSLIDTIRCDYLTDYKECQLLFEGMEQELRNQYSIESSIANLTNKLSNNIEGLINIVTEKIGDFDMSKLGFGDLELEQVKNLLNKYGN